MSHIIKQAALTLHKGINLIVTCLSIFALIKFNRCGRFGLTAYVQEVTCLVDL